MAYSTRIGVLMAVAAFLLSTVMALDMSFCATINTASTSGNHSIYQSDGLCSGFCRGGFAYAIVKDSECWCSDYTPETSSTVDTSKCNTSCPGFQSDTCGGAGVWGYMLLSKSPVGTKGAGGGTSASPTTSKSTTATPSLSVSIVTEGGTTRERTITVMPTNTGTTGGSAADVTTTHTGLSTGQAVGVVIGVLAFFIILGGIGVFLWLRRRRRTQEEKTVSHQNSVRGSSAGMVSTPRTEMASMWDGDTQSAGRRNSRLMPHDPRMDPYAANIYNRFENKSHESVNTLQDNQDYSRRVLRPTNPDPTDGEIHPDGPRPS